MKTIMTFTALVCALPLSAATTQVMGNGNGITDPTAFKSVLVLENVNNTSDAAKPVSTATQTALNLKFNTTGGTFTGDVDLDTGKILTTPYLTVHDGATFDNGAVFTFNGTSKANAQGALNLTPGTYTQAYDAGLLALAGGSDFVRFTGPTSTTKVVTLPNANATMARTDAAQTFDGIQTFSSPIAGSVTGNAATVTTNASETPTLYNNFEDLVLWPSGSTITNNVSQPTVGPSKFWFNTSGTPACNVANGSYGASATGGPWYLGSSVPTSGGGTSAAEMSLGFLFTEELLGSGFNNTFNISFSQNVMMDPTTGTIATDGVVHANFELGGCVGPYYYTNTNRTLALTNASTTVTLTSGTTTGIAVGMFVNHASIPLGATVASVTDSTHFELSSAATSTVTTNIGFSTEGTRFVCTDATWDGVKYPWNTLSNYQITHNRKYAILTKVVGDVLTYTIPGVGKLTFTEPHLHNKIGTTNTYWWFEDIRSASYSSVGRINCVWGGPRTNLDNHPAFGAFIGGNNTSLNSNNAHYLPGTLYLFPENNGSKLMTDNYPNSVTPSLVVGGYGTTTTGGYLKAKKGVAFAEQAFEFNAGSTNGGASMPAYCIGNINTGMEGGALSSAAGAETTLKSLGQGTSTMAGDSEVITYMGRLVGTNPKRIRVVQATYGSVYFDSNTGGGTPLDAVAGGFVLTLYRGVSTANSHVMIAKLEVNGLVDQIQVLTVNLGYIYQSIDFKTTTTDAGGVVIDTVFKTHSKGSVQN